MKFAFCIGNGESRKGFNINSLRKYGTIYGANALFRDLKKPVDHLVCCDRTMAMEAVAAKYDGRVYTRKDWIFTFPYENYNVLPDVPWEESEKYKESLKDNRYWMSVLKRQYTDGVNPEEVFEFESKLNALTVKELQDVAKKYLTKDKVIGMLMPEESK